MSFLKILICLFFAMPVFAETTSIAIGSRPERREQSFRYGAFDIKNLRAFEYYATRYPGSYVHPEWPGRMTLEPIRMSIEDFNRQIVGRWRTVMTCGGRPLTSQEILSFDRRAPDGYQNEGLGFVYGSPSQIRRFGIGAITSQQSGETRFFEDLYLDVEHTLNEDGTFTEMGPWRPTRMQMIRVKETGEILIQEHYPGNPTCPDGSPLLYLYVGIPVVS